jgi:hypothetical protein
VPVWAELLCFPKRHDGLDPARFGGVGRGQNNAGPLLWIPGHDNLFAHQFRVDSLVAACEKAIHICQCNHAGHIITAKHVFDPIIVVRGQLSKRRIMVLQVASVRQL